MIFVLKMLFTFAYDRKNENHWSLLIIRYSLLITRNTNTLYHAPSFVITSITYNLRQAEEISDPHFVLLVDMLIRLCTTNSQKVVLCNLSM